MRNEVNRLRMKKDPLRGLWSLMSYEDEPHLTKNREITTKPSYTTATTTTTTTANVQLIKVVNKTSLEVRNQSRTTRPSLNLDPCLVETTSQFALYLRAFHYFFPKNRDKNLKLKPYLKTETQARICDGVRPCAFRMESDDYMVILKVTDPNYA